ncbi:DUF3072 domain-containing protein [Gryllotalpicola daejeonensis]
MTDDTSQPRGDQHLENVNGRSNAPAGEPNNPQGADQTQDMLGTPDPTEGTLEKDPEEWVSGDDPATEAQKSYLDTLAKEAGEQLPANLTKREASEHIDRLRKGLGRLG